MINRMNTRQGVDAAQPAKRDIHCSKVFFAQYHVQEPTDPLFRLVGNRPALIKVHVSSEEPREAPAVVVMLELGNEKDEFTLRGPTRLPRPYTGDPKLMPHSYDDSFTGIIPREWIKPGLKAFSRIEIIMAQPARGKPAGMGLEQILLAGQTLGLQDPVDGGIAILPLG